MPEAAEILISTEQFTEFAKGDLLTEVSFFDTSRYGKGKKKPEGFEEMQTFLQASPSLVQAQCLGKFQYLTLKPAEGQMGSQGWFLVTHGMTGHWSAQPKTKHLVTKFTFSSGRELFFEDVRRFGTFKFTTDPDVVSKKLLSLGRDILSSKIEDLIEVVHRPRNLKKNVTEFLMSQTELAGVGNYIKAESLFRAKISPHKTLAEVSENSREMLVRAAKAVAEEAYEQKGLYFKNHELVNGEKGEYVHQLDVYRKEFDPNGNSVISEETKDKRTTWWVPLIQK